MKKKDPTGRGVPDGVWTEDLLLAAQGIYLSFSVASLKVFSMRLWSQMYSFLPVPSE